MKDLADAMLTGALFLCAIMIVVWLFRLKTQGSRAYVMASAFACLGGLIIAFKLSLPSLVLWAIGIVLVVLLLADMGIKAVRQAKEAQP